MKILKLPMRKNSTLIYLVNSFQSELKSVDLVETDVDSNLKMKSKNEVLPSDRIIENILNFARSYDVFETKDVGYVEMNLN
jgi:hypothetical protein